MKPFQLIPVLLAVFLSSCQGTYNLANNCLDSYQRPNWSQLQRTNEQNRQLWASKNIKSYSYTNNPMTWLEIEPVNVRVEQGEVFLTPDNTQSLEERQRFKIESYFDVITQTSKNPEACETLSVNYDAVYGFPVSYDWALMDKNLADAFGGYQNTNFVASPQN